MKPSITWGDKETHKITTGVLRVQRRGSFSFNPGWPSSEGFATWKDRLLAGIGSVNQKPVAFANHIGLPETLLMLHASFEGELLTITLVSMDNRGLCEDGVTRHVGWNRFYRLDQKRWQRNGSSDFYSNNDSLQHVLDHIP